MRTDTRSVSQFAASTTSKKIRNIMCLAAAVAFAGGLLGQTVNAAVTTHTLTSTGTNNWTTATWTNSAPANNPGDIATYVALATTTTTLDTDAVVIGQLNIGGSAGTGSVWTINKAPSGPGTFITMDNTGGTGPAQVLASGQFQAGLFTVGVDLVIQNTDLQIGTQLNAPLAINGNITASTTGRTLFLLNNSNSGSASFTIGGILGATGQDFAIQTQNTVAGKGLSQPANITGTLDAHVASLTLNTASGVILAGANVNYVGTTTLTSGTLTLNNANALGGTGLGGALVINGGTINGTQNLTSINATQWNGNFTYNGTGALNMGTGAVALGTNIAINTTGAGGTFAEGGVISGNFSLTQSATSSTTSKLSLAGANLYTGATTSNSGTIVLTGASGSILSSSGVFLNGAGKLQLDNTTTTNNDRLGASQGVTLSTGGEFIFTGNGATSSVTENFGTLSIDTGSTTITLSNTGAGQVQTLAASAFARSNNATALVRGTSLGDGNTSVTRLTLASLTGLTQVGTATSTTNLSGTTKNLTIVPYLVGDSSATGTGAATTANFITYDTAGGLRKLGTNEQDAMVAVAATNDTTLAGATDHNVKVLRGVAAVMSAGAKTFNSLALSFDSATATATSLTGAGGVSDSLTITSGALLDAGTGANSIGGFSGITFGNGEAVIFRTSATGSLSINSPIDVTSSGGLTKGGLGTAILGATNIYTGPTTINQGTLQIGNGTTGSITNTGAITITPQGTLSFNAGTGSVNSNTITDNGLIANGPGASTNTNEISSNITGVGGITISTGNVLVLSGSNSFGVLGSITTGLTSLNAAGTLRAVANGGNTTGGISSALSANSYLTVNSLVATPAILDLRADASTTFATEGLTFITGSTSKSLTINVDRATGSGVAGSVITLGGNVVGTFGTGTNPAHTLNITGGNGYSLAINNVFLGNSGLTFNMLGTNVSIAKLWYGSVSSPQNGQALNTQGGNYTFTGTGTATVGTQETFSTAIQTLFIGTTSSDLTGGGVTLTGNPVTTAGGGFVYNLNSGTLNVNAATALGGSGGLARTLNIAGGALDATAGDITVASGAKLLATNINGDFAFGGSNALNLGAGYMVLNGAAGSRTITTNGSAILTMGQVTSGTATGVIKAGAGTLAFGTPTFYTGGTTINNGTLLANAGPISVSSFNQTTTAATTFNVTAPQAALLRVGQPVSGSTIPLGAYITNIAGNTITISQAATAGTLQPLTFAAGSATGTGSVTVGAAGTLGGSGTIIGAVTNNGRIAPGNSPGILTVNNNVTFNNGSTLSAQIFGATPGNTASNYDQLVVNGTLAMSGVNNLELDLGTFTPTVGDLYTLVLQSGTSGGLTDYFDQLNGVATSLNQGDTFNLGAYSFQISYQAEGNTFDMGAGNGNDIMLQAVTPVGVPEPTSLGLLALGSAALLTRRRRSL